MQKKPSALRGALRRIGGQMQDLEDITGTFVPSPDQQRRDRVYGTLHTHDANVRIGFDASRVQLPAAAPAVMTVSGKIWLDETTSRLTLLVRDYRIASVEPVKEEA